MAYSYVVYTGNGATTQYSVPFPYIRKEHVYVSINYNDTTAFTWVNASTIQMNSAPANGARVEVRRTTPVTAPLVDFADGSTLVAADLDTVNLQQTYVNQEQDDQFQDAVFINSQGLLDAGGKRITNVGNPTAAQDAVTKAYTDNWFNTYGESYLGSYAADPATKPNGGALTAGVWYFNTTTSRIRIHTGQAWTDGTVPGSLTRWKKTAAGGETSLSGADDNSFTLSYTPALEQLFINGALQTRAVDYLATNGTSVTGLAALTAGDVVEVLSFNSWVVATVPDASVTNAKVATGAGIAASKLSFTQAGAGAVERTIDSRLKDVVSAKDFGAAGNGVTDDTAAIAAAVATGRSVDLGGKENTYLVSSPITLNSHQEVFGSGAKLKTTSNISIFVLANYCRIRGLHFEGSGAGTSQRGVFIDGSGTYAAVSRTQVSGCTFSTFGGAGYYVTRVVGSHQGNTLSACTFTGCNYGIHIDERGEYTTVTGCNVDTCTNGIRIIGGNTVVSGSVVSDCTIGILVGTGANDAHGVVTGCLINHSTQYAVKCEDPNTNDFRFADCEFYYGDVWMYRSTGMSFANCTFGSNNAFYFQGSVDTYFESCRFITLPMFFNHYNNEFSKTHWIDTQYASLTNGVASQNINGGYVEVKLADPSNVTIGTGIVIVPFDTLVYNSVTNDPNYVYELFWSGAPNYQLQNLASLKSPNKSFYCNIAAELSIGASSGSVDYSKIHVYMYNVASQREIYFTPENTVNGSNPGLSWKRYTFAGMVDQNGGWRVIVNNQTGGSLVLWREQGASVPFTLRASNF